MSKNILRNGDFEADWSTERSHRCLVFPTVGEPYKKDKDNVFTPPAWTVWYRHGRPVAHDPSNTVGWAEPEVRDTWVQHSKRRVHSGEKGLLFFTFFRIHDGGLFQQVQVEPGTQLRLSAWAHAWSNQDDDPRSSVGVGRSKFFAAEGDAGLNTDQRNFTFWVGIDPTGGTDPYANTVVWGQGAHIYNEFHQVPAAEAVAQAGKVTAFLRSRTLWPFKHNDAYWDDALLEAVTVAPQVEISFEPAQPQARQTVWATVTSTQEHRNAELTVTGPQGDAVEVRPVQPQGENSIWRWTFNPVRAGDYQVDFTVEGGAQRLAQATLVVSPEPVSARGLPREQYERTYVLLPPGAGQAWVKAILESGAWERKRWTVGSSADDAGIGALENKSVIAVNPTQWPSDLEAFFQRYYPCTRYTALEAATPQELRRKLQQMG